MTEPTTAATAEHAVEIVSEFLPCGDGYTREFWRSRCACGWKGTWKFYRTWAMADGDAHV